MPRGSLYPWTLPFGAKHAVHTTSKRIMQNLLMLFLWHFVCTVVNFIEQKITVSAWKTPGKNTFVNRTKTLPQCRSINIFRWRKAHTLTSNTSCKLATTVFHTSVSLAWKYGFRKFSRFLENFAISLFRSKAIRLSFLLQEGRLILTGSFQRISSALARIMTMVLWCTTEQMPFRWIRKIQKRTR